MKKIFSIVMGLVGLITPILKADFVAYQQLYHPVHKTRVHLLFDIHMTKVVDTKAVHALKAEIKAIASRIAPDNQPLHDGQLSREEGMHRIDSCIEQLHASCGLAQQQKDLLTFVKNNPVSLINEDAGITPHRRAHFLETGDKESLRDYIVSRVGRLYNKSYRINTCPIAGVGRKLQGKYSAGQCDTIPEAYGYYYNVDGRTESIGREAGPLEDKIDTDARAAVESLRTTYNQSDIIMSLGARHCAKVAHMLCTEQGYQSGPFIIHQELQELRPECPELNVMLRSFKYHGCIANSLTTSSSVSPSQAQKEAAELMQVQETLISYPLDVAAALQQGLSTPVPDPVKIPVRAPEAARQRVVAATACQPNYAFNHEAHAIPVISINPVARPPFSSALAQKYLNHITTIKKVMIAGKKVIIVGGLLGLLYAVRPGTYPTSVNQGTNLLATSMALA